MADTADTNIDPIALGPFDLFERLGAGGMGIVHRAQHRSSGAFVAVKIVKGEPDDRVLRQFHREVQAHASLQHPAITQLLDYGEVSASDETNSETLLVAGSPWVAMELATGTTRGLDFQTWDSVHHATRQILQGLAHAHARGVIHRDLKPDNLLLFEDDPSWRVKLTDFGIAHALGSVEKRDMDSLRRVIGTPKYMAPEQLLGRWRDHGPWTDLYAVGCIVYEMVCGRPPYADVGRGGVRAAVAHLSGPPPQLEPKFGVPDGLQAWIRRAMEVEPRERFERTAEALAALPGTNTERSLSIARPADQDAEPTAPTDVYKPEETLVLDHAIDAGEPRHAYGSGFEPTALTMPPDWRESEPGPTTVRGAGLGLVGLREPPLVGRKRERDIIWSKLLRATNERAVEVVMLEGEGGLGKTRLASWTTIKAHELGAATVLALGDFTRDVSGLEALLRTWRLQREGVYEHLLRTLPPMTGDDPHRRTDARAVAEILRPRTGEHTRAANVRSLDNQLLIVERLLVRFATHRPVVLWLDDLHRSRVSRAVVEQLLKADLEVPVLVIATVRSDIVADNPSLADELATIDQSPRVSRLALPPLSHDESAELARSVAPLPAQVTAALTERMEGNPLFGVQLLTDWVERDRLARGGSDALPANIHAVWVERIRRLEQASPEPELLRRALELAGTLGKSVDEAEWTALADFVPEIAPLNLWELLVSRGLAINTPSGWQFRHGLLVESLHRLARESARWSTHNRHAAEALRTLFDEQPIRYAGRLARHWVAAGEPMRAHEPYIVESQRVRNTSAPQEHRRLLLECKAVLDELDEPQSSFFRLENDIDLTENSLHIGQPPDIVIPELEDLARRAQRAGFRELETRSWSRLALCHGVRGDYAEARSAARRAVDLASPGSRALPRAMVVLCRFELHFGEEARATDVAGQAVSLALATGDPFLASHTLNQAGWTAKICGDLDRAHSLFQRAAAIARENMAPVVEIDALNGLGDVARLRHQLDHALEIYDQAHALAWETHHTTDAAVVSINWAYTKTLMAEYELAGERLWAAKEQLRGFDYFLPYFRLGDLGIAAGLEKWADCREHLKVLRTMANANGGLMRDDLFLFDVAAKIAQDRGKLELAEEMKRVRRTFEEGLA